MNEKLSSSAARREELKQLRNKANMLASVHSLLSDQYDRQHLILSSTTLVVSTLLVALIFSDQFIVASTGLNPDILTWIKGIVSALNFSLVLLLSRWGLQEKAAQHREATRFYFAILNKIRKWIDSQDEITSEMIESIRVEYGKTESIPKIPNSKFLRLKQKHLQTIAISRELEKQPFNSIKKIKEDLETLETKEAG